MMMIDIGDLIFFARKIDTDDDTKLDSAIAGVGNGCRSIFHVGLIVDTKDSIISIIHAIPSAGVIVEDLSTVIDRLDDIHTIYVCRVRVPTIVRHRCVDIARSKIGSVYNQLFAANCRYRGIEAYYCCQLIAHCYNLANTTKLFHSRPMNFRSHITGQLLPYWCKYFVDDRCAAIPENELGTHPEHLFASARLNRCAMIVIDDKVSFQQQIIMAASIRYVVPRDLTGGLTFVAGKRILLSASKTFDVYEPRSGRVIYQCPISDAAHVDEVVRGAKDAYPEWAATAPLERGKVLRKTAELIREHLEDIVRWEVTDNGKSIWEARCDINSCADTFDFYGGAATTLQGEFIPIAGDPNRFAYTRREPLGVVAGIGAWNYPFQTASWKIAPALACGNAFVYKPSPLAPISCVILAELLTHAGLPIGCINIVQGEKETGEALCLHPDVSKLSFTGSVPTGQAVMRACATRGVKPVTLELGGKSPVIIFEDVLIDNAVTGAMLANFLTQGQVCTNASRVFVHRSMLDEFTKRLVEQTKSLVIGDPMKAETRVGATICIEQLNKVLAYVESAKQEGATILCGGERVHPAGDDIADGYYFSPCIMTNCTDAMKVVREEIFGAVLLILPFDTEDEVVQRANATPYGLAAGVFTQDIKRAHRVAARLQAGTVYVNSYNDVDVAVPFGGYKHSGFGRENGFAALQHYHQIKAVYVDGNDQLQSPFAASHI